MTAPPTAVPRAAPPRGSLARARAQVRRAAGSATLRRLLAVLLAADAALIALHVLRRHLRSQGADLAPFGSMLAITDDHSLGELFGYLKAAAIVCCLFLCYARTRIPVFAALGVTFLVILLDDSLRVHETLGGGLAAAFPLRPVGGIEPQDLGELLVFAGLGGASALVLTAGFARSGASARGWGIIFAALLATLVVFAVGVDLLHAVSGDPFRGFRFAMGLVEDGGEMVTLSATCAVAAAAVARRPPRA